MKPKKGKYFVFEKTYRIPRSVYAQNSALGEKHEGWGAQKKKPQRKSNPPSLSLEASLEM
jgi:hypothetical protein